MKNFLKITILFFVCIIAACKKKPNPTPVVDSGIVKFNITMATDIAISLDYNNMYPKQTNAKSDFAYYNLPVSPEYKSIVMENADSLCYINLSDANFSGITNIATFNAAIGQGVKSLNWLSIDINEPTTPFALAHKYIYISTSSMKKALMRIDNYKPGTQQDFEATVIMLK